jgi:hypothetical protein
VPGEHVPNGSLEHLTLQLADDPYGECSVVRGDRRRKFVNDEELLLGKRRGICALDGIRLVTVGLLTNIASCRCDSLGERGEGRMLEESPHGNLRGELLTDLSHYTGRE